MRFRLSRALRGVITLTGPLRVLGDFEQLRGRLALDVRGPTDIERISIAYSAKLSGELSVNVSPSVTLGVTESLRLIVLDGPSGFYTVTGTFSQTAINSGFSLDYKPLQVLLCVSAPCVEPVQPALHRVLLPVLAK